MRAMTAAAVAMVIGGVLLLSGGSGTAPGPSDDVAAAFSRYESLWRDAQKELANRLDSGQITSEAAATEWFAVANQEARKQAFLPLLTIESKAFGGEQWTAEKHAAHIRRYAR